MENKKRCCTCPRVIVALLLLAVAGGIVVWQVYPDKVKDTLTDLGVLKNNTDTESSSDEDDNGGGNSTSNGGGNSTDGGGGNSTSGGGGGDSGGDLGYSYFQCNSSDPLLTDCCNGLDTICDLGFDEILFPTVHNSMSTIEDGFPASILGQTGANHNNSLEKALEAGYRGLSIDVCNCGNGMELCHGVCGLAPRDPAEVFGNIVTFLKDNPTEIILLSIELNNNAINGGETVDIFELYDIMSAVPDFTEMLYVQENLVSGAEWPTLRQLKEANDRIVIFHYNGPRCDDSGPCPPGLHYWYTFGSDTQFDFDALENLEDLSYSCEITRGDGTDRGFFGVSNFVTPPSEEVAKNVNTRDFVEKRMADCSDLNSLPVNMVLVDFWSIGDVLEVTQEHNKALSERKAIRRSLR